MVRLCAILFVVFLATAAAKEDTTGSALAEVKPVSPSKGPKKTKRKRGSTKPKRERVVGFSPAADAFAAHQALGIYWAEKAVRDNASVTPQPSALDLNGTLVTPQPESALDLNGTLSDQTLPEPASPARAVVTTEGISEIEVHSGLDLKEGHSEGDVVLLKGILPAVPGVRENIFVYAPSGNHKHRCTGFYHIIEGYSANRYPVWIKKTTKGTNRWLYHGTGDHWFCGDDDEKNQKFACATGFISHEYGAVPYDLSGSWQISRFTGFADDHAIFVTAEALTLYVKVPKGTQAEKACTGIYIKEDFRPNKYPMWRKTSGTERWLYRCTDGDWLIGGVEVKQNNFKCSKGFIACRGRSLPYELSGGCQFGKGNKADDQQILVTAEPPLGGDYRIGDRVFFTGVFTGATGGPRRNSPGEVLGTETEHPLLIVEFASLDALTLRLQPEFLSREEEFRVDEKVFYVGRPQTNKRLRSNLPGQVKEILNDHIWVAFRGVGRRYVLSNEISHERREEEFAKDEKVFYVGTPNKKAGLTLNLLGKVNQIIDDRIILVRFRDVGLCYVFLSEIRHEARKQP